MDKMQRLRWARCVFCAGLAGLMSCTGAPLELEPTAVRRLTPTQYNNTVEALLYIGPEGPEDWDVFEDGTWRWMFPADIEIHGFEGLPEGQVSSAYLAEQYQRAAAHYSDFVLDSDGFWVCEAEEDMSAADWLQCGEDSVAELAQRAYRRPLSADESSRLKAFYQSRVEEHDVETAIRLAVQGLLMTPQFLYRIEEVGETQQAKSFALASRLSYFLWNSMPDEVLFEAAANGELSTAKQVEQQAKRMLGDARARKAVVQFHRQWLDLDSVYVSTADMNTYVDTYLPEAEDAVDPDEVLFVEAIEELWSSYLIGVRAAMVREAELFVEKTLFEGDGTFHALLTENQGYITQFESLAGEDLGTDRLYGVGEADLIEGDEYELYLNDGNLDYELFLRPAAFPEDERAGVLTLGAVLASHSHPVHPAPVLRGVFVKERLLCENVGQPPDGAEGAAPPDSLDVESTNRERTEATTSPAECAVCHDGINPLGFAFENFDSLGGWRDTDNGFDVDATGTLETGERVDGPVDLAHHLAKSRKAHDCYALHWTRVALGASSPNSVVLEDIQKRFYKKQGDVEKLLLSIVTSEAFRTISGGAQ